MTEQRDLQKAENQLVQEAMRGEEEAFIQLYHQHISGLYRFVFSKVNSQQDAEDITSETFYQALKVIKSFSGKSTFKNWLYGIAKHLILAKYRERYNQSTVELDENTAYQELARTLDIPDSDDAIEQAEKVQKLEKILADLPQNYSNVLELRFLKGYTILETAECLGITEENAKVMQHRALKKANQQNSL